MMRMYFFGKQIVLVAYDSLDKNNSDHQLSQSL